MTAHEWFRCYCLLVSWWFPHRRLACYYHMIQRWINESLAIMATWLVSNWSSHLVVGFLHKILWFSINTSSTLCMLQLFMTHICPILYVFCIFVFLNRQPTTACLRILLRAIESVKKFQHITLLNKFIILLLSLFLPIKIYYTILEFKLVYSVK